MKVKANKYVIKLKTLILAALSTTDKLKSENVYQKMQLLFGRTDHGNMLKGTYGSL